MILNISESLTQKLDIMSLYNMSKFHSKILEESWWKMSIYEQLGNIGSEVGRAIHWKNKGDLEFMTNALNRCRDLFDLTLQDSRWNFYRKREINTAKKVVCDFLVGNNEYKSTEESLNSYFYDFALIARNEHYAKQLSQ